MIQIVINFSAVPLVHKQDCKVVSFAILQPESRMVGIIQPSYKA